MERVEITSWNHLNDILFEESWDEGLKRIRSPYAFRGLPDANFDLMTSLQRLGGNYYKLEKNILRNFKKYSYEFNVDSVWELMAIAQHYGLPTRLLDWTYSPYVALHFVTSQLELYDRDGVVWCLDFKETSENLPVRLKDKLKKEQANAFTVGMLNEPYKSLEGLQKSKREDFILFFEPPSMDSRIVNQFALFSMMSSPTARVDDLISESDLNIRKIIIPKGLKWEIRDRLDQLNINERTLFPGLNGLCSWLRRHYSPR
jgi:hypothetical protein